MITDLIPKRSKIGKRVKRKLEVLQRWEKSGVPVGKRLPASLSEVRAWSDPSLGVQPIGSPSDFTTTHPDHGHLVEAIRQLLERVREKNSRSGVASHASPSTEAVEAAQLDSLRAKLAESEQRLSQMASQWTMAKKSLETEQRRTSAYERINARKDQIIAEKNEELAELQRQLKARSGLRLVE